MPVGAPRQFDRDQIAIDFITWAKDNPDALSVPMFATARGFNSEMMLQWAKDDPLFARAYNTGKELIGINRLKATMVSKEDESKRLEKSIYTQTLGNYDLDVRAYQREEKRFEASLKNDESNAIDKSHIEGMEAVLKLMKDRQSSARKIEESNISNETQS